MFARLLLAGILAALPFAALADDTMPQSSDANTSLTPQINGALLGPASSADSGTLQPTVSNPLQSQTDASAGLSGSSSYQLQAGNTSDDLKVLISGEADGTPVTPEADTGLSDWPGLILSVIILAGGIAFVLYSRRAERRTPTAKR